MRHIWRSLGILIALCGTAAAQTQIKPRVMLMVDTSGSMTEDTVMTNPTGGDGSTSYQDQFMTISSNETSPNLSAYRGFSTSNTCPAVIANTIGSTSKMAAAKAAVTNVINGSGDIDWGLMRYTGSQVGFPTSFNTGGTTHNINPDPEIWPTANPLPQICTGSLACASGSCDVATGRCTRNECNGNNANCAGGRTCDATTNQCTCGSNADCGGTLRCSGGLCKGMGDATCTAAAQCISGTCNAIGRCTCSNNNQCTSGSCDTNTGVCRCSADNQCPTGTCHTSTGECVVSSGAQCPSGQQLGSSDQCKCTANSQCTSNSCDIASGRCLCTANAQCRSNSCDTTQGVCRCTADNQCWGAATCGGDSRCVPGATSDCPTGTETGTVCSCGAAGPCINGETCTAGTCVCTTNAQCGTSFGTCNAGVCGSGGTACTTENDCPSGEWCVGGVCGHPNTLVTSGNYGMTDTRGGQACGAHSGLRVSYSGSCGTSSAAGAAGCNTPQNCFVDSTCGGATASFAGQCALIGSGPARSCSCTTAANCPANYTCTGSQCVYNVGCRSVGGVVLVDPTSAGYAATQILPYADGIEIFTNNGSGGITNPELRANGSTPLGGAARSATTWYNAIKTAAVGSALYDPQLLCRPYIFIMLTDGVDTCDSNADAGSVAGVQGFVDATAGGAKNINRVEVIGLSTTVAADQTRLNNMAIAGASNRTTARYANNQSDIEAALADIVASSVLIEQCNGADDNCNNLIDEGLGVQEDCTPGSSCGGGKTCDSTGRCPCDGASGATQCDPTFTCSKITAGGTGVCVPICTVGVGACQNSGIRKCGGACCLNDGLGVGTCTTVVAGAPGTEICNNIDDNCNGLIDEGGVCTTCQPIAETCDGKDTDCNGVIDNGPLADVGQSCGSNIGTCTFGTTACVAASGTFPNATDHLVCVGGTGPTAEVCDGLDNDCDGITDGMTQACFDLFTAWKATHPAAMRNTGVCADGAQACDTIPNGTIGMPHWGACTGESGPSAEICDGKDNDCNGLVDDGLGGGGTCCPSGKCGVGVCTAGTVQCVPGGGTQCVGGTGPSQEICDNLDNDCNGTVDDVPGKGAACTPTGSMCGGHLVCNTTTHTLDCVADAPAPEICNGIDDDCNGIVDDPSEIVVNDSRLNQPCDQPMAPANLPPCKAGTTICQNGTIACQGAVTPQPNVCGEASRDCETSGVFNGNCPSGFMCFDGTCAAPCSTGEFPCPGGFVCKHDDVSNMDFCISDACAKVTCPKGQICKLDDKGNASCFDPCSAVTCPSGLRCNNGLCVDDSCLTFGCPDGQICVNGGCSADPCFDVVCDMNEYCSPSSGKCVRACQGQCPPSQQCVDGDCTEDPCAALHCGADQACLVSNGVGMCVMAECGTDTCGSGLACCGGMCVQDSCAGIQCPAGAKCSYTAECNPTCIADAPDKIVGAGGGGFTCDVAGGVGGRTPLAANGYWLLLALGAWLVRRRRSATR
jgi:hypothetical protein